MLGLGVIFNPISNLLDSYSARLIMTMVGEFYLLAVG